MEEVNRRSTVGGTKGRDRVFRKAMKKGFYSPYECRDSSLGKGSGGRERTWGIKGGGEKPVNEKLDQLRQEEREGNVRLEA